MVFSLMRAIMTPPSRGFLRQTSDEHADSANAVIPYISDVRVKQLLAVIRPTIRQGGVLHYFHSAPNRDPVKHSYLWCIKPEEVGAAVPSSAMTLLTDVSTYHSSGESGAFKPTIAEILAQIPSMLVDRVGAFELLHSAHVLEKVESSSFVGHRAVVRLYAK